VELFKLGQPKVGIYSILFLFYTINIFIQIKYIKQLNIFFNRYVIGEDKAKCPDWKNIAWSYNNGGQNVEDVSMQITTGTKRTADECFCSVYLNYCTK
jgi:hypothetical protein